MYPDLLPGVPLRALLVYLAGVLPALVASTAVLGRWLDSLGLPWLLTLGGVFLAWRCMVWFSTLLSVPAVHGLVRRWPVLGRGRVLASRREDEPHASA